MTPAEFITLERARLDRMTAKLTAQLERQEAARNPAFAADWDRRFPVRFTDFETTPIGLLLKDASIMATAFNLDDAPTAIVEITPQTALALFTDKEKYSEFYSRIKAETDKFVPDLTSKKGRDAIASEARKVVAAKTTLEKAGKGLVEEWRAKTAVVTSARIAMVNELDALAKEVRRPLTEWEEAEKARVAECQEAIDWFKRQRVIDPGDTAAGVRKRGTEVYQRIIDPERFGDMLEEATAAKDDAVATLKRALDRLTQEEADRAELERLRAEKAEAEAKEAAFRRQREWADQIIQHCRDCGNGIIGGQSQPFGILLHELEKKVVATAEEFGDCAADVELARTEALARVKDVMARADEDRRAAAEKAAQERIERAKTEAAANVQREAEKAAQAERDRVQKEHEEALAAERAKAAEAERLRKAEADRITEQERQREAREAAARAEEKRLADEKAELEANKAHRQRVKTAAKNAIMVAGASEEIATAIVKALIAGQIPGAKWSFS